MTPATEKSDATATGGALWRGRTQEERRAERRRMLLDAALEIVAEEDVDALGVRAVCRRSGLTERYFYESFASLDELLGQLYETVIAEVHDEIVEAMRAAGPEPRAAVGSAVGSLADQLRSNPVKSRLFLMEHSGRSALAKQIARKSQRNRAFFAQLVVLFDPALADDAEGLDLSVRALLASQAALFLAWAGGELPVTRARFVEHTTAIVAAVATVDSSGA